MDTSGRKFFEHYATPSASGEPSVVRAYVCPCCGYPTLSEPASHQICDICNWEDDGGDGYGPNAYSLEEAREHFRQYLTSYGPTHEFSLQGQRETGLRFIHDSELRPDNLEAKRQRISAYERYMAEPDLERRGELWEATHGQ